MRFITDDNISVISLSVSKQEDSGALIEVYSIIPIASKFSSSDHRSITSFNEQLFSDVEADFSTNGFAVNYDGKLLFKFTPVADSQALGCGSDIQILDAGIPESNHPASIAEPILPQPMRIRPRALMSSKFICSSHYYF
mgnify:CR=1 FL=1